MATIKNVLKLLTIMFPSWVHWEPKMLSQGFLYIWLSDMLRSVSTKEWRKETLTVDLRFPVYGGREVSHAPREKPFPSSHSRKLPPEQNKI